MNHSTRQQAPTGGLGETLPLEDGTGRFQSVPEIAEPLAAPMVMLGVSFDRVTMDEAMERIERMIASRRPHYVVTANVDFAVQARHDLELHRILLDAHLVLCDGTPLVWVSGLFGNPLPERVAGADLVPRLIRCAAKKNYRLFFLGGASEVTSQAVDFLRSQYPTLTIAGHYSPPFRPLHDMDHEEIARRILAARPDIVFVSFGCPKAEKWIAMNYESLGVPVMMGVGATIDFLAGRVRRAPVWMQRAGAEWLFRLLQEPRRLLGRYLTDLWYFSGLFIAQWWQMQAGPRARRTASRALRVTSTSASQRIAAPACFNAPAVKRDATFWSCAAAAGRDCLLDLADVRFIDATGMGLLVRLAKQLRTTGRYLVLLAPSRVVQRALRLMRLESFFIKAADAHEAHQVIQWNRVEQWAPAAYGTVEPDQSPAEPRRGLVLTTLPTREDRDPNQTTYESTG